MAQPLLALAVALVLVLLAAVLAVLIKLVLWLTVSRTLLALAAAALYWFVASRRRRYARGFYSCSCVPQAVATPAETTTTKKMGTTAAHSDEAPVAVTTGENESAAFVRKPTTIESQLASSADPSVPVTTEAPAADTNADDRDAGALTNDDAGSYEMKAVPVRRRSMQLPGPLKLKLKGDAASSPSLSATESEDDEDELALTRPFVTSRSATSPMRATSVSPAPVPAARKVRPRSSSSSSGFSATNRKRLLGSPVRHPQSPHVHPHSSTPPPTVRPHPHSMTPVRSRRSATIATNNAYSTISSSSSVHGTTPHNKRSAFARRSATSERELMQEKMAADGYWIGDFRLERQLVTRRSFLSNTANGTNGDRSGNNSARSSPRAV